MPIGSGASIITLVNGTTASATDVNANFTAISNSSISNDGLISTDGNGNLTVVGLILSTGHIVIPNNLTLQIKDTSGTAHDVMYVDNANEMCIQMATNTGGFKLKNANGVTVMHVDSNGNVNFKASVNANVGTP